MSVLITIAKRPVLAAGQMQKYRGKLEFTGSIPKWKTMGKFVD
jgi:hypothetical protein